MGVTRSALVAALTATIVLTGCDRDTPPAPTAEPTTTTTTDRSESMDRSDVAELLLLLSPIAPPCPPPTSELVITGDLAALLEILGLAPADSCTLQPRTTP
jgi:ABC-type uncharacterized transport system auxiliary subunit